VQAWTTRFLGTLFRRPCIRQVAARLSTPTIEAASLRGGFCSRVEYLNPARRRPLLAEFARTHARNTNSPVLGTWLTSALQASDSPEAQSPMVRLSTLRQPRMVNREWG